MHAVTSAGLFSASKQRVTSSHETGSNRYCMVTLPRPFEAREPETGSHISCDRDMSTGASVFICDSFIFKDLRAVRSVLVVTMLLVAFYPNLEISMHARSRMLAKPHLFYSNKNAVLGQLLSRHFRHRTGFVGKLEAAFNASPKFLEINTPRNPATTSAGR